MNIDTLKPIWQAVANSFISCQDNLAEYVSRDNLGNRARLKESIRQAIHNLEKLNEEIKE